MKKLLLLGAALTLAVTTQAALVINQSWNTGWDILDGNPTGLALGDQATLASWGLDVSVVPEPATWALGVFGLLAGIYAVSRRALNIGNAALHRPARSLVCKRKTIMKQTQGWPGKRMFVLSGLLLAVALGTFPVQAQVAINIWLGGVGPFTNGADWDTGRVPAAGEDAYINNGGTVQIRAGDPIWTLRDIRTGEPEGGGNVTQSGGTVNLTGWLRLGRAADTTGAYAMSGGTLAVLGEIRVGERGSATLTLSDGHITNGSYLYVGTLPGASGVVNMSGGTFNVMANGVQIGNNTNTVGWFNLNGGSFTNNNSAGMSVGRDEGAVGYLNITNGTFVSKSTAYVGRRGMGTINLAGGRFIMDGTTTAGQLRVGDRSGTNAPNTYGTVNHSGGELAVTQLYIGYGATGSGGESGLYNLSGSGAVIAPTFIIGAERGNGRMEMTGGTLTSAGAFFAIGHRSGGKGVLNQSGGTITHTADINNVILGRWISPDDVAPTGTWTLSGTAQATVNRVEMGQGPAVATLNLNGGTLATRAVFTSITTGTATVNFNGGTLQARLSTNAFVAGLTAANVLAGGAVIDSAGYDITIPQPLLDGGGGGGLTKRGAGTLILTGTNTYTGDTVVEAGTLQLDVACLNTNAAVRLTNSAALNLNFEGTNRVAAFVVDGVNQGGGTFSSSTHPGRITGTGKLQVGAAATPGTLTNVVVIGANYQFTIAGSGSQIIQASTNLADPAAWVPLATNSAPFTFTDTNAAALYPWRFYRTVTP